MDQEHQLRSRTDKPLICIVTVGELLAFAKRNNWGQAKADNLMNLLRELVVVDIRSKDVLERYAEFSVLLDTLGRIPQNDVWIAATASVSKALILTCDKDFDRLHPAHLKRVWYDPKWRP